MKEQEFLRKFPRQISVNLSYSLDDDGNVMVDEDDIRDAVEDRLDDIHNAFRDEMMV